jgi:flagellar biosynthesis protein FlhF
VEAAEPLLFQVLPLLLRGEGMNLQTFKAATMAEALAQVKSSMGHDAVILHTRTYQRSMWLGLRRREIVEITAGRGLNMVGASRRPPARAPQRQTTMQPPKAAPIGYVAASKQLLDTPAASRAMMFDLSEQMASLKTMVKDLTSQVRHQHKPQVPEELFDIYTHLISNQVCDELAIELITNVQRQLRPEQYRQADFVREKIAEQIEKLIPIAGPIKRTKTGSPHVVALIGPTGVGKTTTIAKLAANLKLKEKRKVGLITIDTYRIAAIDQLKKYADIIGSTLKVVSSPEELAAAVKSMGDCDYVLIDTAGRSPKDVLKLGELKNFLASAEPDEVHLVLSTTCSQDAVELAIERFGDVRVDRMIFTKLDEAAHAGVMLNIVRKVNKPLSYVTTGQDVPDDIEDCNGRRVAQLILGSNL